MRLRTLPLLFVVGTFASGAFAQLTCALQAGAIAYSVETNGYNDSFQTGWLPLTASGGPAIATASGSGGNANGCSTSSSIRAVARYGHATVDGSGSATNCLTDAGTIYTLGSPGASSLDLLTIDSTVLPAGTRAPVRVRVDFRGSCTSVQPAAPFCQARFRLELGGSFGPFVLQSTSSGVFEGVTDVGLVGSSLTILCDLHGTAGASTVSIQPVGGPSTTATCSVNTSISFTITSLDPRITLVSCSGHNYAVPYCAADFNGDGALDPDDLADFIGAFFSVPPNAGSDFNGDGVTDPDDLADYIGAFFSGC